MYFDELLLQNWWSGFFFFYRGWFEVHIRPFPAWEENIPEEPQHQKSKERRHFGSVAFISFHCHSCNQSKRHVYYLVFLLSSSSCLFFCVMLVCLCHTQIEVIHDYQESRSCVSYSLEGEDSPDLLKRWGGGSRPHVCPSSVLLLMLFTLWFSLFGGNDALWLSLCLFPCARQSCDEGTHRDRTNLCGRAAGSSAGEEKKTLPPHFTIDLLMVKGPLVVLHLH